MSIIRYFVSRIKWLTGALILLVVPVLTIGMARCWNQGASGGRIVMITPEPRPNKIKYSHVAEHPNEAGVSLYRVIRGGCKGKILDHDIVLKKPCEKPVSFMPVNYGISCCTDNARLPARPLVPKDTLSDYSRTLDRHSHRVRVTCISSPEEFRTTVNEIKSKNPIFFGGVSFFLERHVATKGLVVYYVCVGDCEGQTQLRKTLRKLRAGGYRPLVCNPLP